MGDVRPATLDDIDLLASIAAAGFHDDPVMSWIFPDEARRHEQLTFAYAGLTLDFLPDRGTVHILDDACVTFWRQPYFDAGPAIQIDSDEIAALTPYPSDVLERLAILDAVMAAAHPHDAHWYLNVIGTLPERQGTGLGARAIRAVLEVCD